MATETKPVLIFERNISASNRAMLEHAGYIVVCTNVPYTTLGKGSVTWFHKLAWQYMSSLTDSNGDKRAFGCALIHHLVNFNKK